MPEFLEAVRVLFPPVLNGHLAARLGESVNGMKRALQGAVPVMLTALLAEAAEHAQGSFELCRQAHQRGLGAQAGVTGILVVLGSRDAPGSAMVQGRCLLETAFATSADAVVSALSQYARIQPALARIVLELVGAVLLGALYQHAIRHQLDATNAMTSLGGLKSRVRALLPPELKSVAAVLDQHAAPGRKARPAENSYAGPSSMLGLMRQWYKLLMVMLAIVAVSIAAFGILRPAPKGRLPEQTMTSSTAETVTTMAQDSILLLQMIL